VDPVLLQAVVLVELDILGAVQRSYPTVRTREEALKITTRCAALPERRWGRPTERERGSSSPMPASWNQIAGWLKQIDSLRHAA